VFKQPEQEILADSTVNTQPALLLHTRSRASGRGTGNAAYELVVARRQRRKSAANVKFLNLQL
jgi:hypothetical protein